MLYGVEPNDLVRGQRQRELSPRREPLGVGPECLRICARQGRRRLVQPPRRQLSLDRIDDDFSLDGREVHHEKTSTVVRPNGEAHHRECVARRTGMHFRSLPLDRIRQRVVERERLAGDRAERVGDL